MLKLICLESRYEKGMIDSNSSNDDWLLSSCQDCVNTVASALCECSSVCPIINQVNREVYSPAYS